MGQESRLGQHLNSQLAGLDNQPGCQDSQYILEVLKYEHVKLFVTAEKNANFNSFRITPAIYKLQFLLRNPVSKKLKVCVFLSQ